MLILRLFFIVADKISRFAKFWLPIQNLNSVARSEIPYLNWRYDFVTFSHNFCENAWTSSLCRHPNNGVFSISTVVMWTRNAQVSFHIINSWISSILEIPACIFSLRNLYNVQFYVGHILLTFLAFEGNLCLQMSLKSFLHTFWPLLYVDMNNDIQVQGYLTRVESNSYDV